MSGEEFGDLSMMVETATSAPCNPPYDCACVGSLEQRPFHVMTKRCSVEKCDIFHSMKRV